MAKNTGPRPGQQVQVAPTRAVPEPATLPRSIRRSLNGPVFMISMSHGLLRPQAGCEAAFQDAHHPTPHTHVSDFSIDQEQPGLDPARPAHLRTLSYMDKPPRTIRPREHHGESGSWPVRRTLCRWQVLHWAPMRGQKSRSRTWMAVSGETAKAHTVSTLTARLIPATSV